MTFTAEDIKAKTATFLGVPLARVTDDTVLRELVADSFRLVEMVIELQEVFKIRLVQDDLREVRTAGDLAAVFLSKIARPGR